MTPTQELLFGIGCVFFAQECWIRVRHYLIPRYGVFRWITWPQRKLEGGVRRNLPDHIYKAYYRDGVMDAETYREYQQRGYITDDLDPEYLQRRVDE